MFKFNPFNWLSAFTCCLLISLPTLINAAEVDPTAPFGHRADPLKTVAGKKLVLESIIHGDGIHTAVINGKVMKPLDTIGEYKLTAVNDQSVVLRSDTQRLKLYVFKENIVNVSAVKLVPSNKVVAK